MNQLKQFKSTIDIFKILNKSNCGLCYEKTCLAFAALVFKGQKSLNDCPCLDKNIIQNAEGKIEKLKSIENEQEKVIQNLKQKILDIDLSIAAQNTGGYFSKDRLILKVFGKDFTVCSDGKLISDVHINTWLTIPLLIYVLNCKDISVSGKWIPFRELKSGRAWQGLFRQQCEIRLKKIADTYTNFFEDIILLFNGNKVENHYESDISLVLYPLPKIPILICYWKQDESLESDLNIFFDSTSEDNSSIQIFR